MRASRKLSLCCACNAVKPNVITVPCMCNCVCLKCAMGEVHKGDAACLYCGSVVYQIVDHLHDRGEYVSNLLERIG